MVKYLIEGGNLPVVICYSQDRQTIRTDGGSMRLISLNIKMEINTGGGIKKVFCRLFLGESFK